MIYNDCLVPQYQLLVPPPASFLEGTFLCYIYCVPPYFILDHPFMCSASKVQHFVLFQSCP